MIREKLEHNNHTTLTKNGNLNIKKDQVMAKAAMLETYDKHFFRAFKIIYRKGFLFLNFPGKGEFALKFQENLGEKQKILAVIKTLVPKRINSRQSLRQLCHGGISW